MFLAFLGPPTSWMIYSTVNHQKLPFSNPTHPPLWWRNTWMVPTQIILFYVEVLSGMMQNDFSIISKLSSSSIHVNKIRQFSWQVWQVEIFQFGRLIQVTMVSPQFSKVTWVLYVHIIILMQVTTKSIEVKNLLTSYKDKNPRLVKYFRIGHKKLIRSFRTGCWIRWARWSEEKSLCFRMSTIREFFNIAQKTSAKNTEPFFSPLSVEALDGPNLCIFPSLWPFNIQRPKLLHSTRVVLL